MTRPSFWRTVLVVAVVALVGLLLGVTGHRLAAGLLGLAGIGYELVLLGWLLIAGARDALAARVVRRGHPDEEAAIRAARLHLGIRNGGAA